MAYIPEIYHEFVHNFAAVRNKTDKRVEAIGRELKIVEKMLRKQF